MISKSCHFYIVIWCICSYMIWTWSYDEGLSKWTLAPNTCLITWLHDQIASLNCVTWLACCMIWCECTVCHLNYNTWWIHPLLSPMHLIHRHHHLFIIIAIIINISNEHYCNVYLMFTKKDFVWKHLHFWHWSYFP